MVDIGCVIKSKHRSMTFGVASYNIEFYHILHDSLYQKMSLIKQKRTCSSMLRSAISRE